jgi:hypothetical protein
MCAAGAQREGSEGGEEREKAVRPDPSLCVKSGKYLQFRLKLGHRESSLDSIQLFQPVCLIVSKKIIGFDQLIN